MLDYARLDTRYLIPLRNLLDKALDEKNRKALAEEDFKRLCTLRANGDQANPGVHNEVNCWRVSGSYDLDPQNAAVLLELCRYRDNKARSMDRPLFKVIGDQTLLAIAAQTPTSSNQLKAIKGMSVKQVRRHGRPLLKAVRRGLDAKPIYPPRAPRQNGGYVARMEALRMWRKETAKRMGVKSDVIMPRNMLHRLASQNPQNKDDLADTLHDVPWRLEQFGETILGVLVKDKK
jgi:ribonuclease D